MSALHQSDAPKYQQFSLGNPFRLDYSLVPHLMGKLVNLEIIVFFFFIIEIITDFTSQLLGKCQ